MTSAADEAAGWEATRTDVYERLRECLDGDRDAALAVVTGVEGSAYRPPGAKLVVTEESAMGAITAGCLEGPVAELARDAVAEGRPRTETYDLTDDSDEAWGMGLGCNGVVSVLVDPVDESLRPAIDVVARKGSATVCTVVASDDSAVPVGARSTFVAAEEPSSREALGGDPGDADRPPIPDSVTAGLRATIGHPGTIDRSRSVAVDTDGGEVTVFCDVFEPVPDLLVFGSQGDVRPVARFGREAGFRVRVATGRGAKADPERFPAAAEVHGTRAPAVGDLVAAPEATYAVVMSHNFVDDRVAVEKFLDADVPYVGLMGPRERFAEIRESFAAEGRPLEDTERDRISTPVGLDLGGDDPTQIALSVVSEVLAVSNGRTGGRLSAREGPIHAPEPD